MASEKNQIITQLKNLNSLEFTFDQLVNEKREKGNCLLEFPGKLKCEYFDDKKKELIRANNGKIIFLTTSFVFSVIAAIISLLLREI